MDITIEASADDERPLIVARWVAGDGIGEEHQVDLDAIASWSELLGHTDAIDTLEAILRVAALGTEPEPDERTGENAWTEAFAVLQHREVARESEVFRALQEGTAEDPRSPALRGALAARRAVMEPIGATRDCDSLLARCRDKARSRMACACPTKASICARPATMTVEERPQSVENHGGEAFMAQEDRAKARAVLEPLLPEVRRRKARFLHSLTGNPVNPLGDDEPDEVPEVEPVEDPGDLNTLIDRCTREEAA
ncbi:hypothetical protein Q7C18_02725 [Nesterenkonia sp. CL21]|uniref:hypothetical protein n=1 Tax=Nesterenkonia sp. CL21 TaxID=3064894 RepID=UPI00287ADBFF|nr:hypothetical protein [Nesterenkonia sp. CL21]MDS2171603.1 hypothetical protein [Nesterenkonia sp. CL21]